MDPEVERFLNLLAEAERAGARVLRELVGQAGSLELMELLKKSAHDEGYWAGELRAQVRRLGGSTSNSTGDFVAKVRQVADFASKLELLNRGQRWVSRKIDQALPTISDERLRAFLMVMKEGHDLNVAALEARINKGSL